jgi:hypothetical protein
MCTAALVYNESASTATFSKCTTPGACLLSSTLHVCRVLALSVREARSEVPLCVCAQTIKPDLTNWEDSSMSAWPYLIDEFVEHLRAQQASPAACA